MVTAMALVGALAGAAHAYSDPNLGGLIYQLLFPIITVVSIAYLTLKKKINNFIVRIIGFIKDKMAR